MINFGERKSLRQFLRATGSLFFEYRRPLLLFVSIIVLFIAVVNGGYFVISAKPKSCLVCHYMEPHYETWQNSAHKDVGCIECHPGRRTLIDSYMLRYLTGTYHARPQPDVKPGACLKCHEATALSGEILYKRNIKFNHEHHLGQMRRGKKLRCTSCHSTGQAKEHFTVDNEACYLCHFKDADKGRAFTSCNVCHGVPQGFVEHQGFKFNHETYASVGVECAACHTSVATGNGDVQDKKCYECHVERFEARQDPNKVHRIHIAEHGIDCFKCHDRIDHGKVEMASAFELDCNKCHAPEHAETVQIFIGSGGKGISNLPSTMFLARVSCEACHAGATPAQTTFAEKRAACVKCHGADYDLMLDNWKRELDKLNQQTRLIANQLQTNGKRLSATNISEKEAAANSAVNMTLMVEGKGVHNPNYSLKLATQIFDAAKLVARATGSPDPTAPDILAKPDGACKMCHVGRLVPTDSPWQGATLPHKMHAEDLELACTTCHTGDVHPPRTINTVACQDCH